jgi:hypothetical protein
MLNICQTVVVGVKLKQLHAAEFFYRSHHFLSYPSMLWNPEVHYSVLRSPPLIPALSQIKPFEKPHSIPPRPILIPPHIHVGLSLSVFLSKPCKQLFYTVTI